ncbi:MAG: tyrosine-type recombinase/integrase, partial [Desulfovibrio sp.]|nr:tyrosine-type recombinase/integrase [Desulfovibrio sp.]
MGRLKGWTENTLFYLISININTFSRKSDVPRAYEADTKAGIPLVCHRNGSKVLSFRTAWLNACKKAGVVMRPYDIRHIAATEMLARGADLAAVAAQLGHSNVATTGAFYAHVTAGSQSRAASLMPSLDDEK